MLEALKIKAVDKYTGERCDVEFFGKAVFKEKFGEWQNWEDFIPIRPTGLKDKNGREIYEGDLLKHPVGVVAEIKYDNDIASFVAIYASDNGTEMNHLDRKVVKKCEVVGNIYENPELLEGEE